MKDEISKIIKSISDFYKLDNALKYYLDRHKAQILLDYIINLQEENDKLQNRMDKAIEYTKENQYRLDLDRIKNELLEILGEDNE